MKIIEQSYRILWNPGDVIEKLPERVIAVKTELPMTDRAIRRLRRC